MFVRKIIAPLGICMSMAAPALAADQVVEVPPPSSPTWTIGIEGSPEFYAINNGSNRAGTLATSYYKLSVSHTFDNNFVGGVFIQPTFKSGGKSQYYLEGSLGYKFKLTDAFTLTPSVGIGYTWHDTGIVKDAEANANVAYYALYLAGDLKLSKQWTWNAFNLRWRNAFNATWETPKVATGVTYNIDSTNAVYANVGYAWKKINTSSSPYNDLAGDKINVAIGYKHSF
jgi:hypothetical protein